MNKLKKSFDKILTNILNKINSIGKKVGIYFNDGCIVLRTNLIALAIDAILYALSKIGTFAFTNILKIVISWLKTNSQARIQFWNFFKKYIFENAKKIAIKLIFFLIRKMVTKVKLEKIKDKMTNFIIGDSLFVGFVYNLYTAFSSFGNIIATVFDLMDRKWDQQLIIAT